MSAEQNTAKAIQKTTLVFPIDQVTGNVLLGMKKRGFGADWWNGFGGKLDPGETYKIGAARETFEECGIRTNALKLAGRLLFYFEDEPQIVSAVYVCNDFTGEPHETEEMRPQWFAPGELPLDQMWGGDKYWIPSVLAEHATKVLDFVVYFDKANNYLSSRPAREDEITPLFDWEPAA